MKHFTPLDRPAGTWVLVFGCSLLLALGVSSCTSKDGGEGMDAAALERRQREARRDGLAAQREADRAEKAAREAKADVASPREFKEARDLYKRGKDALQATDTTTIARAWSYFMTAQAAFEDVIEAAKIYRAVKEKASLAREEMLRLRAQAVEVKAEELARQELLFADQQARNAEVDFKNGYHQRALESFQQASQAFASAVGQANIQKALAQSNVPGPGGLNPSPEPGAVVEGSEPKREEPAPGDFNPPPEPGAVVEGSEPERGEPRTVVVGVPEVTPDLSEDDAFLQTHHKELAAGVSSYDPYSGEIVLDLPAHLLKNSIYYPQGIKKKHIWFKDPWEEAESRRGAGRHGGRGRRGGAQGEYRYTFSFHGNTQGLFLIPVPLTGEIVIEYVVKIQIMDRHADLGPVLFSSPKGLTRYDVEFIRFRKRIAKSVPKVYAGAIPPEWNRSPYVWFDKAYPVRMRVEVAPDQKRKNRSIMAVYYKYGETTGRFGHDREARPANQVSIRSDKSGYVGFQWDRAKFNIRAFKITGKLDKKAAVKLLKKKLDVKD
ncbi:MAG: hypothetical protein O7J95_22010 [Planctomycetota bacterium]|nr:hypothetical protein [Planctomycetota bacterium]